MLDDFYDYTRYHLFLLFLYILGRKPILCLLFLFSSVVSEIGFSFTLPQASKKMSHDLCTLLMSLLMHTFTYLVKISVEKFVGQFVRWA
jgi:hypothetical protein